MTDVGSVPGRVMLLAPSAYPLGGVATWIDYLVPGLQGRGWEVQVGLASGALHDAQAYRREHPGLPAVRVESRTGSREGRVRALARAIADARPDLVVAANIPDACAAVERLRLGGRGGPRVVMAIHGLEPDLYDDLREWREVVDGAVCTNRLSCRLAIEDAGVDEGRVHYAPYGVEVSGQVRAPSGGAGPVLEVAFAGRIEESQKRVGDLARIAVALAGRGAPVRITIAGDGPDDARLRARLAGQAAAGTVRFLGRVPAAEVAERVYRPAQALLVTSSWETGPIVAWEAMARGVCVVSSRYVGSGLEGALVDGENCLLFPVGDAEAGTAAIEQLTDARERGRIARGGLELVRRRYSVAASVRAWHEALLGALQSAPAGRRSRPAPAAPAGRLDRALGGALGESVRELLGRRPAAGTDPGAEWPHSYGRRPAGDQAFWRRAAEIDGARPGGRLP